VSGAVPAAVLAGVLLLAAGVAPAQTPATARTPIPLARRTPVPAPAASTAPKPSDLGTVRPVAIYQKSMIAVPFFNVEGQLPFEPETLPRIIRFDLDLSGYFTILDPLKANSLNLRDVKTQKIAFKQWQALGVQHYLMGSCKPEGTSGAFSVLTYLYYIPTTEDAADPEKAFEQNPGKFLVFGKRFQGTKSNYRDVAHQISDEVVKFLKGADGIAQTRIAYVTDRTGRRLKEVGVMDADGFGQSGPPLTNHGKLCATPCWGANGTEMYFTSYRDYNSDLYGVSLDGKSEWYISRQPGLNTLPDWSETRKQIVFVLSKDGNSELYTCDRAGKGLKRITTSKPIESSPSWSPDGSRIAFTSDREGGHPQIFIMNADGSGAIRVTKQGSWNDAPSWSPKGDRIAFVSKSAEGTFDIYSCTLTGGSWRRLTMNQGDNEAPSWAPDGHHLAFSSNRSGKWQIYIMLDDGSNQRQLTQVGANQQPDWGPAPK